MSKDKVIQLHPDQINIRGTQTGRRSTQTSKTEKKDLIDEIYEEIHKKLNQYFKYTTETPCKFILMNPQVYYMLIDDNKDDHNLIYMLTMRETPNTIGAHINGYKIIRSRDIEGFRVILEKP